MTLPASKASIAAEYQISMSKFQNADISQDQKSNGENAARYKHQKNGFVQKSGPRLHGSFNNASGFIDLHAILQRMKGPEGPFVSAKTASEG